MDFFLVLKAGGGSSCWSLHHDGWGGSFSVIIQESTWYHKGGSSRTEVLTRKYFSSKIDKKISKIGRNRRKSTEKPRKFEKMAFFTKKLHENQRIFKIQRGVGGQSPFAALGVPPVPPQLKTLIHKGCPGRGVGGGRGWVWCCLEIFLSVSVSVYCPSVYNDSGTLCKCLLMYQSHSFIAVNLQVSIIFSIPLHFQSSSLFFLLVCLSVMLFVSLPDFLQNQGVGVGV